MTFSDFFFKGVSCPSPFSSGNLSRGGILLDRDYRSVVMIFSGGRIFRMFYRHLLVKNSVQLTFIQP